MRVSAVSLVLLPVILFAGQSFALAAPSPGLASCRASQLRLSLNGRDGEFNGMSHSGVELSIQNLGPDCTLPALPVIQLSDTHGRVLEAIRRPPVGMHPGPVMVPVRLVDGHRAASDLRWVSGPVFPKSRIVRVAALTVRIGTATLRAPLTAVLFRMAGQPAKFEQSPIHVVERLTGDTKQQSN